MRVNNVRADKVSIEEKLEVSFRTSLLCERVHDRAAVPRGGDRCEAPSARENSHANAPTTERLCREVGTGAK